MATLETGIRLNDMMSAPIRNILTAMNMMLTTWDDLETATSSGLDSDGIAGIRDQLNQATMAVQQLDSAMQDLHSPVDSAPVVPQAIPMGQNAPIAEPDRPLTSNVPPIPEQQVPFRWTPEDVPVFSGSERYAQEIQNANSMMETLNETQRRITEAANQTDLFPPDAVNDISGMQNRLQGIANRIRAIENNPLNMNSDIANAELEQLRGQLSQAVRDQQELNRAVDQMDVEGANEAYLRLSRNVGNTERYIRDNTNEQGEFNRAINRGSDAMDGLTQKIMGAVGAFVGIQGIKKLVGMSDEFTQTTARLNMINDGLQTTDELVDKIMASSNRARSAFTQTADTVAKLSLNAGDAFGSNDETILFAENLNKLFAIAGTDQAGIASASLQLTQALGSGVLRGEEFNAVFEAAPNIMQTIADAMGVPIGSLRGMAAEGKITADIVKNAMLGATDTINDQFQSMPMTWGQVGTQIMNELYYASIPLLEMINWIAQNWEILEPIVLGIAAAVGIYTGVLLAHNAVVAITGLVEKVHAASAMMATGATFAQTAAQHGLNAALMACPITWIIIAIIALIALFYAAVGAVNKFAGTSLSATGIICGAFMTALAFIGNIFIALWNIVADVFVLIYNLIAEVANFVGNVFTDPIGAVARLFFGLADTVLGVLETLASAIDTIFGSDLAGSVRGWRDSLGGWVDETFGKGEEVMAKMSADDLKLGRFEYGEAWDAGYAFGEGIDDKVGGMFGSGLGDEFGMDGLMSNVGDIADSTGSVADSLDITSEDLKYLRDLAEQETINRFTTAEVKVEVGGVQNTVNQNTDLDGVVDYLATNVQEALERVAEGVHS